MNKNLFLSIGLAFSLASCSLTPEYEKPEAPIPSAWQTSSLEKGARATVTAEEKSTLQWRNFFTDQRLIDVIETALANNRNGQIAALNVQRARAMYNIQRAELYPTLDLTAGGTKRRASASSFGGGGSLDIEQYNVDLGISSWEIDFFGRMRNLEGRALEEYFATEEAHRSVKIGLVFEVANAYLTLAADRESLHLAQNTYEAQKKSYELIKQRFDNGLSNKLDLRRAQTQVDSAQVDISRYEQLTAQDQNALNLLIGYSTPLPAEWMPEDLDSVQPSPEVTMNLPSEILLNRPDILAAEHHLKAAYANIGAARAAFFPRISLSTAIGTASGDLSDLFSSGTDTWSYAPQLVMPIFDSRLRSAYKVSKVEKEIALAQYEQAIQTSFREVADVFAVQDKIDEQLQAQESLVDALDESYQLSNTRYTKGQDSYLSVLDAQRSLYTAEQGLVQLRLAKFSNQARLYAVLGGVEDEFPLGEEIK